MRGGCSYGWAGTQPAQMSDAESEASIAMLQEFIATGAHYDEMLRALEPAWKTHNYASQVPLAQLSEHLA